MKWVMRSSFIGRSRSFSCVENIASGFGSESLRNSDMWLIPIAGILLRAPGALAIMVGLSLCLQLGAAGHLIILPEEWDASFNKALPILIEGDYIEQTDIPAVRRILKAAADLLFSRSGQHSEYQSVVIAVSQIVCRRQRCGRAMEV